MLALYLFLKMRARIKLEMPALIKPVKRMGNATFLLCGAYMAPNTIKAKPIRLRDIHAALIVILFRKQI